MSGPFIFDDLPNILENQNIRINSLCVKDIITAGFESPASNRPVSNISFALDYYFHKYNVAGYHLVNILIHIMAGIFLYFFVKTTLSIPWLRSSYGPYAWIPFFTASIWLLHPIQSQSVTYIVQRMNSLAATFYILALLLYAKARVSVKKGEKRALFAGCIFAGILALGSKEIAGTLPIFIVLYEWYFFQDLNWTWLKRHTLLFTSILILFAFMAFMFVGSHPLEIILESYKTRDFTMTQRVLTEFRVVIHYISLLIFPHPSRLNLDYDFPLSYSLIDPITTLFSMGAIVGLIVLAVLLAKKERVLSFCILWFLGNLAIESSVIGLEIIFEHRTYLPSMLVSLMAVILAYRYIRPKWLSSGVMCGVLILCSVWTYERNCVWSNDVSLWADCVEKSPGKARPHYNLGVALEDHGRLKEAISQFSEALRIKPNHARSHDNLGGALARQGKLKEAISQFSEALRIKPDYAKAHNNLGNALASQGKLKEAISQFSEALRIKPDFAEAHYNLGIALTKQEKFKEAIGHYFEALRIKPDYADAHYNLGNVLARQGRLKEAIGHFSEALRIRPGFVAARQNMELVQRLLRRSSASSKTSVKP